MTASPSKFIALQDFNVLKEETISGYDKVFAEILRPNFWSERVFPHMIWFSACPITVILQIFRVKFNSSNPGMFTGY